MKRFTISLLILIILTMTGCMPSQDTGTTSLTLAAASSLKTIFDQELIPLFEKQYPHIKLLTTYDGSGKLQTQIEEGASIDVFLSASNKQMNALDEKGLLAKGSTAPILSNEIVMIVPSTNTSAAISFFSLENMGTVAIGDPESVPAGEYAKELLANLGVWETLVSSLSYGTNVSEVLNWVAEGSADAGIVYSTDAMSNDKVRIAAVATTQQVTQIIYPIGILQSSQYKDEAELLIDFLKSEEALTIFERYGFSRIR